jgi:hypothetical protein
MANSAAIIINKTGKNRDHFKNLLTMTSILSTGFIPWSVGGSPVVY